MNNDFNNEPRGQNPERLSLIYVYGITLVAALGGSCLDMIPLSFPGL